MQKWGQHRKKSFSIFPSPAGMSFTKLSMGGNNDVIYKLFPPRESLVSDIPAGDGNIEKLFLQCIYKKKMMRNYCDRSVNYWANSSKVSEFELQGFWVKYFGKVTKNRYLNYCTFGVKAVFGFWFWHQSICSGRLASVMCLEVHDVLCIVSVHWAYQCPQCVLGRSQTSVFNVWYFQKVFWKNWRIEELVEKHVKPVIEYCHTRYIM